MQVWEWHATHPVFSDGVCLPSLRFRVCDWLDWQKRQKIKIQAGKNKAKGISLQCVSPLYAQWKLEEQLIALGRLNMLFKTPKKKPFLVTSYPLVNYLHNICIYAPTLKSMEIGMGKKSETSVFKYFLIF